MAAASYSKNQLIKIIGDALALALHWGGQLEGPSVPPTAGYRKAADKMLAEGVDLDTAFIALRRYLRHSRGGLRQPTDFREPQYWERLSHWQSVTLGEVARDKAAALAILRAALAAAGPFITIPKLGKAFHIRYGPDISGGVTDYGSDISGIESVTENGILSGRDIVLRPRVERHPGGRPTVPQEVIDELDREACAALVKEKKPLSKKARAGRIRPALATKGHHLAEGTIKNRLKARPLPTRTKTRN